jgi:amino acid adenylation domain-containing protein
VREDERPTTAAAEVLDVIAREAGVPPERVDPDASFTELGLDSLGMMTLSEALEARLGRSVPFRRLMEDLSTLRRLVDHVESLEAEQRATPAAPPPVPASAGDPAPAPPAALTAAQLAAIRDIGARHVARTATSQRLLDGSLGRLADPRIAGRTPDGRRWAWPVLTGPAGGGKIRDADGNVYVDLSMASGACLFGHAPPFLTAAVRRALDDGAFLGPEHPTTNDVAERLRALTGVERVAFCISVTEAVMSALRLARTVTRRPGIAVFAGSHHGHFDGTLARRAADSPWGTPLSPGVPRSMVADVAVLDHGAPASVEAIRRLSDRIGAVLVEPVQPRGSRGPQPGFLRDLRRATEEARIALIFDETTTGFRCHPGGAQALFDVRADMVVYGSLLGGGMPLGVVGGRARFLDTIDGGPWAFDDASSPQVEQTFFGGTFYKHPCSMAAASAVIDRLIAEGPELRHRLDARAAALLGRLRAVLAASRSGLQGYGFSSVLWLDCPPGLEDALSQLLLERGVYAPAHLPWFLSTAHEDGDLDTVVSAVEGAVKALAGSGALPREAIVERPLDARQRQLWILAQLGPEASMAHNECGALRLRGRLDIPALRAALSRLIARHEALRTTFRADGEAQIIHPAIDADLPIHVLSGAEGEALAEAIRRRAAAPFDLERGPLFRTELIQLRDDDFVLVIALHHLITDGSSMSVLLGELTREYTAAASGAPSLLEAPAAAPAPEASDLDERFWVGELHDPPPPLALPLDRPRPPRRTFAGAVTRCRLSRPHPADVRALAAAHGTTTFVALLAAYTALLHHLTGQPDLIVGIHAAPRAAGGAPRVGYFVRLLPLRSGVEPAQRFSDHLVATSRRVLAARDHQDVSLPSLSTKIGARHEPGRTPLVAATFNVDRPAPPISLPGLTVEVDTVGTGFAKHELSLNADDTSLTFDWTFNTDLFSPSTIQRWNAQLGALLAEAARNPDSTLAELAAVLDGAARERHSPGPVGFLDGGPPLRDGPPVHQQVEQRAAALPAAIAVVAGEEQISYRELNARANRLARELLARGVRPGVTVAVLLDRGIDEVVAALAALKAGGAFLLLDPETPPDRLRVLLADAAPAAVITWQGITPLLRGDEVVLALDADAPAIAARSPAPLALRVDPAAAAYGVYTSGSTGTPKASINTHAATANLVAWLAQRLDVQRSDRVLRKAPGGFDVGVWEIFLPLAAGATIVVAPRGAHRDMAALARLIHEQGVTIAHFVPSLLGPFLDEPGAAACRLSHVLCGGEALPAETRSRFHDRLSGATLHHLYGPSETAVDVTAWRDPAGPWEGKIPMGSPIAGVHLHLFDEAGLPAPAGVPAELFIGGVALAHGYHRRPGLTAESFVPDPCCAGGKRLYRTRDRVRQRADGTLEFLGRIDDQIKLGGVRIEPAEIEVALGGLPGVKQAAVALQPGPAGPRLVGYVVGDPRLDPASLAEGLSRLLPSVMIPSAWVFLDRLPTLMSGKIHRAALPQPAAGAGAHPGAAPRSPVAQALAAIWSRLLGVEGLSVEDGFFSAGGHSLLAMRLAAEVRDAFGVELPLGALFDRPRLGDVAEAIAELMEGAGGSSAPIPDLASRERAPLSLVQEQIWLAQRVDAGSAAYNTAEGLRLTGDLDVGALRRSLDELLIRHPILATTIAEIEGQPWQVAQPGATMPHRFEDLTDRAPERQPVDALLAEVIGAPFHLDRDLPARALTVKMSPSCHLVVLAIHHIACDEGSLSVLLREALVLYQAFVEGRRPALPAPRVSYAAFAAWQRSRLPDVLSRQLGYWRERFSTPAPPLAFPGAEPLSSPAARRRARALAAGQGHAVKRLTKELGVTPFVAYLSVYLILLQRACSESDLVVVTPVDVRAQSELDEVVGPFVNLLPLRVDLGGAATFADVAWRARAATLGALAHREIPFQSIVATVAPERSGPAAPLAQVGFAFYERPVPPLHLQGLTMSPLELDPAAPKLDLLVTVDVTAAEPVVTFEHAGRALDPDAVEGLLDGWVALIGAIVEDPQTPLSNLALTTPQDQRRIVDDHNPVSPPLPGPGLLGRFRAIAARRPDALALEFADGSFSYAGLARTASAIARRLKDAGVGAESPVGLLFEGSAWLVASLLGVLEAGGAFVPLHPSDPPTRIAQIVREVGMSVILAPSEVTVLPGLTVIDVGSIRIPAAPSPLPAEAPDPATLTAVLYTSGSTGQPKAVGITHGGLLRMAVGQEPLELTAQDGVVQLADPRFDAFLWEVWTTLLAGGRLVGIERDDVAHPKRLAGHLAERAITAGLFTTALLHHVATIDPAAFAGLRLVLFGGEAADSAVFAAACGACPRTSFVNGYGPTEATTVASLFTLDRVDPARRVPIGGPIRGARLHVLDDAMAPVAPGVAGELYIGGEGLARGYLRQARATAARFVPDPFARTPGARLYATGDRARRLSSGLLDFLGRADEQVKIRGYRVDLLEIERRLEQHPSVRDAVVLAIGGAGMERWLCAHLVPRASPVDAAELIDFLRARGPSFQVPAEIVWHAALPLTSRGKVDRAALAAASARTPRKGGSGGSPETPTEALVAGVWAAALGGPVGRHDDFFHHGGHSLIAARITAQLGERLGLQIPLRLLFDAPTVARVAAAIDALRHQRAGAAALPGPSTEPVPSRLQLALQQQQIWLFQQLFPNNHIFHIHLGFRGRGPVDADRLARAVDALARRHDALRTVFAFDEEQGPAQVVLETVPSAFEVFDLRALPPERIPDETRRILGEVRDRPFDFDRGPLFRAALLHDGPDSFLAVLVIHHIVCDGASLAVLARELGATYAQLGRGQGQLPAAAVQYGHFVRWQREHLTAERLPADMQHWRDVLEGDLAPLPIGNVHRKQSIVFRFTSVETSLDEDVARRLQAVLSREGATLFAAGLAALGRAVLAETGATSLRVSTLVANRHRAELLGVVGLLATVTILRLRLPPGGGPLEALRAAREAVFSAFDHLDLPFEEALRVLESEREIDRSALAQVMLLAQETSELPLDLTGLAVEPAEIDGDEPGPTVSGHDLLARLDHGARGLRLRLQYEQSRLDTALAERMLNHLRRALEEIAGLSPADRAAPATAPLPGSALPQKET